MRYDRSMELGLDVAFVAGLIGEPARAAILVALVDGRALPAGELAFIGNIAPQTASFHLRKLMDASLVLMERHGKHSYYRLANGAVAATLEALASLAPVRARIDERSASRHHSDREKALRYARSCYKHLAGILAVDLARALVERRLIVAVSDRAYSLTDEGHAWCRDLGLRAASGTLARACLDWTERRHHLGGPLGVALLAQFVALKWLVPNPETRVVRVTHAGARAFEERLGIAPHR